MSLQQLETYFNHWPSGVSRLTPTLCFSDHGAFGVYGGLQLRSVFQPILGNVGGQLRPMAFEALLRAYDHKGKQLTVEQLFARASSADEVVFLDRLCRIIHSLNFTNQGVDDCLLFLNVHGRHLLSIGSGKHGAAFETLLGYCGLRPSQVVLEIIESDIDDLALLQDAIGNYKKKGFRIAIDDFGARHSNFDRLWQLTPDLVKLDRELIVQSVSNPRARIVFPKLVEIIHDLGARVVCEGIETHSQHQIAQAAGADFVQGFYYARPAPLIDKQLRPAGRRALESVA